MNNDIINQLEYYITNELRMPAGLIITVIEEIERLRRLGDTLAYHVRAEEAKEMYSAVYAWEKARHE